VTARRFACAPPLLVLLYRRWCCSLCTPLPGFFLVEPIARSQELRPSLVPRRVVTWSRVSASQDHSSRPVGCFVGSFGILRSCHHRFLFAVRIFLASFKRIPVCGSQCSFFTRGLTTAFIFLLKRGCARLPTISSESRPHGLLTY